MRFAVTGEIPSGCLVRVFRLSLDIDLAFEKQHNVLVKLLTATPKHFAAKLLGDGELNGDKQASSPPSRVH